jgi:hypothetical protein
MRSPRTALLAISCAVATSACIPTPVLRAQSTVRPPEVRQIVTFQFQPGKSDDAMAIYERQLKPIYADVPALRRFRAYREAESPEPLDLVVVSTYDGMAGMDSSNAALKRPRADGTSAFALYGTLSGMTQTHHDQFVEMIPVLSDTAFDIAGLTVFEYVRIAPGRQEDFVTLLWSAVRPYEKATQSYAWSEAGRMLVADGWDFVRIFSVRSLGDWHRYAMRMRVATFGKELNAMVAARKTIILRQDPRLSVR